MASAPTDSLLVTLALDAPSVEKVVYAAEFGTVWLSNEPDERTRGRHRDRHAEQRVRQGGGPMSEPSGERIQ